MRIENNTHWRTSDIKRVIKSTVERVGLTLADVSTLTVEWQTSNGSKASVFTEFGREWCDITLRLPKRGPKDHHRNAMLAIACSAAQNPDAEVLAFQEVFRFVNILAFRFVDQWCHAGTVSEPEKITSVVGTITRPDWDPIDTFQIQKYKDPLKDGTYLDFVEKKQKAISRAEKDIERETERIASAHRRLKLAKERKKKAEKALKDARSRRT